MISISGFFFTSYYLSFPFLFVYYKYTNNMYMFNILTTLYKTPRRIRKIIDFDAICIEIRVKSRFLYVFVCIAFKFCPILSQRRNLKWCLVKEFCTQKTHTGKYFKMKEYMLDLYFQHVVRSNFSKNGLFLALHI